MSLIASVPGWLRWGALGIALLLLPAPVVSTLEENDSFCAACHTAPEVAYVGRAGQARAGGEPPLDLSSAHYLAQGGFRCIDCHRGDGGPAHRAAALALGARDTLIFLSGRADPALEKTQAAAPTLLNAACVTCHTDSLLVAGFENHFHNKLPDAFAAWQAGGPLTAPPGQPQVDTSKLARAETSLRCLDCHRAHVQVAGGELTGYLDVEGVTLPACVKCHTETGQGPLELVEQ